MNYLFHLILQPGIIGLPAILLAAESFDEVRHLEVSLFYWAVLAFSAVGAVQISCRLDDQLSTRKDLRQRLQKLPVRYLVHSAILTEKILYHGPLSCILMALILAAAELWVQALAWPIVNILVSNVLHYTFEAHRSPAKSRAS